MAELSNGKVLVGCPMCRESGRVKLRMLSNGAWRQVECDLWGGRKPRYRETGSRLAVRVVGQCPMCKGSGQVPVVLSFGRGRRKDDGECGYDYE